MSKYLLKEMFDSSNECEEWSLKLIKIQSNRNNVDYYCREVQFEEKGRIKLFVEELSERYLSKKGIDKFSSVDQYSGDVVGNVVYKLESNNELIQDAYNNLIERIALPDTEDEIDTKRFHAYAICGMVSIDNQLRSVKMISMHSPLVAMTNKFSCKSPSKKFSEIKENVLSLRQTIDIIIIDKIVYLLNMSGEKLFSLERTYNIVCNNKVKDIIDSEIVSNPNEFKTIATSGYNPRRFVSYNQRRLEVLLDKENRKRLAKKFGIRLSSNDLIETDSKQSIERFVKFLCNKAMLDPVDESPVEVASSKHWQ